MVFSENKGIYVIATPADGKLQRVTGELVGKAREIGDQLHETVAVVLMGSHVKDEAEKLIPLGADEVDVIESPLFNFYDGQIFEKSLCRFLEDRKSDTIFFAADAAGKDLAPRVCGKLTCGLTADVTEISADTENKLIIWSRPAMGENIMADIIIPDSRPQVGTVHAGSFAFPEADPSRKGKISLIDAGVDAHDLGSQWISFLPEASEELPVDEASIIIAGGRGIHSKEEWDQLHELAALLGGSVGCTRPITELGWEPLSRQIGQSGKSVNARLYFAFGISGAMQHLCGVKADVLVAVNKDPHCPMMKAADYAVEADVKTFIPALIRKLKALKA